MRRNDSTDPFPSDFTDLEIIASSWLNRQDDGLSAAEEKEFNRWLESDPEHELVYARMSRTWQILDRMGESPASAPRAVRNRVRFVALALSAAAAIAFTSLIGWQRYQHSRSIELTATTEVGGWRTLNLPDGSTIQLNTDTRLTVHYTEIERRIQFERGEAHFDVAKNSSRPFVVAVGSVAVQAVGTAFNVKMADNILDVLVTEGTVRVDSAAKLIEPTLSVSTTREISILSSGERLVIPPEQSPTTSIQPRPVAVVVPAPEIDRALSWRDQRLKFVAERLSDVVKEFNRYNRHKLVIEDTALAAQRFGGTFRPDRYQVLVDMLEQSFEVESICSENRTLLRPKRD